MTDIRFLQTSAERERAFRVFWRAMVGLPPLGDIAVDQLLEAGRYLGAFDDAELIGGADSYTSWLTVPGGARVPHAAVTHIGVLPTHTRRGILTSLVTRQLTDIAGRGELVASLRASEAVIYRRFGYGVATSSATYRIQRRRALAHSPIDAGSITLLDTSSSPERLAAIYERAAWTGAVARPPHWWRLHELLEASDPVKPYVVTHAEGYVRYRPRNTSEWFASDTRTISVDDLVAHSDNSYRALVGHLLGLDLVDVIELGPRPVDDPLPHLVTDPRAVTVTGVRDETWLRLVDVEAALAARTYADTAPVVIEVRDDLLPHNSARFAVGADKVRRTQHTPDVSLDVAALGSVYLGGNSWTQLARAGLVSAQSTGAVTLADALFSTGAQPFAGTNF
ncbi:Enhanced intracellular survival protein [Mycobacteroides salmoniphilum]|uniref:Enhanced intracellular survival protein n=1 Tax=Mycobacteroides salmoniphilum TaxID=404941 RepID=A0A4R8S356_9MYCO|nr:GNAT family N-acetyltransferase [Mycobacteroides salmoniphilum]TDZ76061.1 Enhanced intracellular survival protein [Mycobacteroides salmoniphilum]TDZ83645.1 Enhanced intracellular survival protein [Mycobacteroides salmoniphilum]TDZ84579.1 Enhanced intracellular survival protein [Mycobacteroides salmoniphilum]